MVPIFDVQEIKDVPQETKIFLLPYILYSSDGL